MEVVNGVVEVGKCGEIRGMWCKWVNVVETKGVVKTFFFFLSF